MLRYRLFLDLFPVSLTLFLTGAVVLMGLLALFGGYVLRPLQEGRPLFQPAPQKHLRSVPK